MESFEDWQEFDNIWRMLSSVYPVDEEGKKSYNKQFEDYIPLGTTQEVNDDDGSINWWDPVTKVSLWFRSIHARNAFVWLMKQKGKFVKNNNGDNDNTALVDAAVPLTITTPPRPGNRRVITKE